MTGAGRRATITAGAISGAMPAESLTALDATFLELEEVDQSAHMHIGAVMIFEPPAGEGRPSIATLRTQLLSMLDDLPRYRQRLSEPRTGGLRWPRWVDDERFDIAHHLHLAGLPAPAGEPELLEWAGEFFSRRLDRARPLWEVAVLELSDGRWAMATKTHHCMVDGVGSVDAAQMLLDTEPGSRPRRPAGRAAATSPMPPRAPEPGTGPARRLGALASGAGSLGIGLATGAVRRAVGATRAGIGVMVHPHRAREALHRSRALVGVLARDEVIAAPSTSLNQPMGATRRLAVVEFELEDLATVKRSLGGTVNDVVLALSAAGLRRLFEHRGEPLPRAGVRAMVPVNVRTAAERLELGNRVSSLFVHLPIAEPDPLRRYQQQVDEAEHLKAGTQSLGSRELIDLASHAPPVLHSFLARALFATRLFNVTVTNVPGPRIPLYAFGSRLEAVWPLVPLAAEHGLGIAVFSFDGRIFFCINAARDLVPDLDLVADGIAEALTELTEIAGGAPHREPAVIA